MERKGFDEESGLKPGGRVRKVRFAEVVTINGIPMLPCHGKLINLNSIMDSQPATSLANVQVLPNENVNLDVGSIEKDKGVAELDDRGNINVNVAEKELIGAAISTIEAKNAVGKKVTGHVVTTNGVEHQNKENGIEGGVNGAANAKGNSPNSYAASLKQNTPTRQLNFRFLDSGENHNGADVVLPRESVKTVHDKLAHTLYGYFLGDRVAFPVVDYFVRANWQKYGIQKIMMNANGFFFFKFADKTGMINVLKGGPWLIRNKPIFLNTWSPTTSLKKEDIKKVAVWIKLHDVPLAAYTDDGLSMLASKLGSPKLLDSYTSSMCLETWGRSSYARALIEISAETDFTEKLTIAIPELEGDEYVTETVGVEYEWQPPRCAHCRVFGHNTEDCPIQVLSTPKSTTHSPPKVDKGGFTEVKGRRRAKKSGFQMKNQKPIYEYRRLDQKKKVEASSSNVIEKVSNSSTVQIHNPFDALRSESVEVGPTRGGKIGSDKGKLKVVQNTSVDSDEEEVEDIYDETSEFIMSGTTTTNSKGARTSYPVVSNG